MLEKGFDHRLRSAVRHFWRVRAAQTKRQAETGVRDAGARSAVTGGKQMDGFIGLLVELLAESGLLRTSIFIDVRTELPGFFRAEKKWDLIVVADGELLACIEAKSQVGPSFGNNFNNRTEEAIGSATDLWTAYREGALRVSSRPWLGYMMLLEETSGSTSPVSVREPHFRCIR